jgi:hypothetical protein
MKSESPRRRVFEVSGEHRLAATQNHGKSGTISAPICTFLTTFFWWTVANQRLTKKSAPRAGLAETTRIMSVARERSGL